ncbi:hypothetical protein N7475_002413, partial [Penicillium sp. IBT 31633x]
FMFEPRYHALNIWQKAG